MKSDRLRNILNDHAARLKKIHLRDLLEDAERQDRLLATLDDLTIDFSHEKLDLAALDTLIELAEASGFQERCDALFAGRAVNSTEGRAALHMALRGGAIPPADADVEGTRDRFLGFAESVRAADFTDVVNIGIGGSDLGPAMAAMALRPDCDGPHLHFVSNVDGAHFGDTVRDLRPETTLVIVSSKTFTTTETMANARLARAWLGAAAATNMAAVSANIPACEAFGVPEERVFGFWDWVGGRYSIWSAIGLSLAIGIGAERFREFLAGAAAMDRHFREASAEGNLPLLMALVTVWRRNFMGCGSTALIPYDQRLARLPAYVQQLSMESNGKRISLDGSPIDHATIPVVWGEPGASAQHSFFQLLHQGTEVVPVDFIAAALPRQADEGSHDMLLSSCIAQMEALARGRTADEARQMMVSSGVSATEADRLAPHREFPGDRPSTLVFYRQLTPYALGRLIALFEHRTFAEAVIWNINPFDQWGVELGKEMTGQVSGMLTGKPDEKSPSWVKALATRISALRQ